TSVSAGGNITLAAAGGISQVGSDSANHLTMTAGGNISANASAGTVRIQNADLTATSGNIDVYGNGSTGVELTSVTLCATAGNISVFGQGKASSYDQRGAVSLAGSSTFSALNTGIHGVNTGAITNFTPVGVYVGGTLDFLGGSASILGESANGLGIHWRYAGSTLLTNTLNIQTASFTMEGRSEAQQKSYYGSSGGIGFSNSYYPVHVIFNISGGADVRIIANASLSSQPGFALDTDALMLNKYIFTGDGSVDILGKSGGGAGVMLSAFDNSGLNGSMNITGESVSGTGVNFDR
ncbi:TPA: hypothetical protein ACJGYL_005034, partial [Salmonella enterica subsp. enterica serovar Chester]